LTLIFFSLYPAQKIFIDNMVDQIKTTSVEQSFAKINAGIAELGRKKQQVANYLKQGNRSAVGIVARNILMSQNNIGKTAGIELLGRIALRTTQKATILAPICVAIKNGKVPSVESFKSLSALTSAIERRKEQVTNFTKSLIAKGYEGIAKVAVKEVISLRKQSEELLNIQNSLAKRYPLLSNVLKANPKQQVVSRCISR
jgi:hypothetical protein